MNQKKSLIDLLLVSTAALSGYQKGAARQYRYCKNCSCPTYRAENAPAASYANNIASSNQTQTTQTSQQQTSTMPNAFENSDNVEIITPENLSSLSPTAQAQADNTFLPALLAALYAADEVVGMNPESTGLFTLPPLEYDYNALEPYISERTLRIHHDKLHRKYVDNLNAALARYPEFYPYTQAELLLFPDRLPSDIQTQVVNNAGGDYNHSLAWKLIGPSNKTRPTGDFAEAINTQFGSFENLKDTLKEAGLSVFGTGYAWLTLNPYGRMLIATTEEQLTPIPLRTVPLLPIDVWEHVYFLDHEESRTNYIDHYLNLVNWSRVGARYDAAMNVLENANELNQ